MTVADYAGVIGGVAGIFAAAAAFYALRIAIGANEIAKQGNGLAKSANNTATEALGQAEEANSISIDANQLAGNANAIAERALHAAQDDVPYLWRLKIDDDGRAVLINDSGHPALQATAAIDHGSQVIAQSGDARDVEPLGELVFDVTSALEKHFEEVRANPYRRSYTAGPAFVAGGPGKPVVATFRAHVRWFTEQQVPRTCTVEEVISHLMGADGMKRRRGRTARS